MDLLEPVFPWAYAILLASLLWLALGSTSLHTVVALIFSSTDTLEQTLWSRHDGQNSGFNVTANISVPHTAAVRAGYLENAGYGTVWIDGTQHMERPGLRYYTSRTTMSTSRESWATTQISKHQSWSQSSSTLLLSHSCSFGRTCTENKTAVLEIL